MGQNEKIKIPTTQTLKGVFFKKIHEKEIKAYDTIKESLNMEEIVKLISTVCTACNYFERCKPQIKKEKRNVFIKGESDMTGTEECTLLSVYFPEKYIKL